MAQAELFQDDDNILGDDSPSPENSLDTGVTALNTPAGIPLILIKNGMRMLKDVVKHPREYFLNLQGMGETKVRKLGMALEEYGLKFAPSSANVSPNGREYKFSPETRQRISEARKKYFRNKRAGKATLGQATSILTRDIKPTKSGFYFCPECENDPESVGFSAKSIRSMAQHRSQMHGVLTPHSNSAWYQKRHQDTPSVRRAKMAKRTEVARTHIETRDVKPVRGLYHCPECDRGFTTKVTMGTHRRLKHQIQGTSRSAEERRKQKQGGKKSGRNDDTGRDARLSPATQPRIELRPSDFHPEPDFQSNQQERANHDFFEYSVGFCEGHIRTYLDFYCQQTGGTISADQLAQRLAKLLGG